MKSFMASLFVVFIIVSCQSQKEWKEKSRQGIVDYFHKKHPGVIVDSLDVFQVEKINKGEAVYRAFYTIHITDTTNNGIMISIDIPKNAEDEAILNGNFVAIDR